MMWLPSELPELFLLSSYSLSMDIILTPPTLANPHATFFLCWFSIIFDALSIIIIARKAYLDRILIRLGSFALSLMTVVIIVLNTMRLYYSFSYYIIINLRNFYAEACMVFMIIVVLHLGARLYPTRRNHTTLWRTIVALTIVAIVLGLVCFVMSWMPGEEMAAATELLDFALVIIFPMIVVVAYCYAFAPLLAGQGEGNERQSPIVVAVGIWYLTGMGFLFIVETITAVLVIPFPPYSYPEFDIDKVAIATFLRTINLVFYSVKPSHAVITYIREMLPPADDSVALDGIEMKQNVILPSDNKSLGTVTSMTAFN
ncbi:hypothetical protein BC937DRAFT_95008 [Endogone sp. FLAS-F59071]|nr:hypothetical protein BC937DRAFT_95008 [Endogone sp. FLAS-F59071]|eukprot:RUS20524.1 hypothetical protein BC937DRAFT_95008 [Endogone sp. FLAS-F59071]